MRTFPVYLLGVTLLLASACAAARDADPPRHLIYLHGRIIQDQQNRRPEHPQHGPYELDAIAEMFRSRGFIVSAEMRPKEISVGDAADVVVRQVRQLLSSGVPPERITVAGASMGASIAMRAAARLAHPEVRFALIAPCFVRSAETVFKEEGAYPSGRILAVREESDVPSATCTGEPGSRPSVQFREVVLNTGLAHGFLYRPLPEWVEPVVKWARNTR